MAYSWIQMGKHPVSAGWGHGIQTVFKASPWSPLTGSGEGLLEGLSQEARGWPSQGGESELSLSLRVGCSSGNERWRAEKKNTVMNQESRNMLGVNKVLVPWPLVINTWWAHYFSHVKNMVTRTSLVVQWLRFHASTAGSTGLILVRGTKIPHGVQCRQKPKVCVYVCVYIYIYTHMGLPWWLKTVKNLPATRETQVQSLGWEDPLEKGMTTHSRIPWTEEPGGLQSLGVAKSQTRLSD